MLVHLSSGSHSINGHVEDAPRSDDVEDSVDVLKDGNHHLILVLGSRSAVVRKGLNSECTAEHRYVVERKGLNSDGTAYRSRVNRGVDRKVQLKKPT